MVSNRGNRQTTDDTESEKGRKNLEAAELMTVLASAQVYTRNGRSWLVGRWSVGRLVGLQPQGVLSLVSFHSVRNSKGQ